LEATTGANKPGQNPDFHAPLGGAEAATRRPISTAESWFGLCSGHGGV